MPETVIPWEKAAYKDGREKGRVEGLEEGRVEGLEKGILQSIVTVLEARFEKVPRTLASSLKKLNNIENLQSLLKEATKATSLDEFKIKLNKSLS